MHCRSAFGAGVALYTGALTALLDTGTRQDPTLLERWSWTLLIADSVKWP